MNVVSGSSITEFAIEAKMRDLVRIGDLGGMSSPALALRLDWWREMFLSAFKMLESILIV